MSKACRQWAVAPDQLWALVISLWNPEQQQAAMFIQHTLPFGAGAAVLHFNRKARLVWELFVIKLRLTCLNFYDDFPMIEPEATAAFARTSAQVYAKLLGWQFSADSSKSLPFDKLFSALGVVFGLSRSVENMAFVFNKII